MDRESALALGLTLAVVLVGDRLDNLPPALSNYGNQFDDSVHVTMGAQYCFRKPYRP